MATPDVSALQGKIDTERTQFLKLRERLAVRLGPLKADADAVDHVISFAEELGPEAAFDKVGQDPQFFSLQKGQVPAIKSLLRSVVDSGYALGGLVAERENILCKADSTRKRVYTSFGREFTIDMRNGVITYLDGAKETSPLKVEVVHTKDQPDSGRSILTKESKERGRS